MLAVRYFLVNRNEEGPERLLRALHRLLALLADASAASRGASASEEPATDLVHVAGFTGFDDTADVERVSARARAG